MAMDAAWHAEHPLPRSATTAERIAWHEEHARRCGCRPIPARLLAEMQKMKSEKSEKAGKRAR